MILMYTSLYNVHRRVTIHVITLLISQSKHDVHNGLNQNVQSPGIYISNLHIPKWPENIYQSWKFFFT